MQELLNSRGETVLQCLDWISQRCRNEARKTMQYADHCERIAARAHERNEHALARFYADVSKNLRRRIENARRPLEG